MKQIRLNISNYHAVNKADIELKGITVLTGPNGCGKSTLSRWLYYYLFCGINFESQVLGELRSYINSITRILGGALIQNSSETWNLTLYNVRSFLKQKDISLEEYDELYRNLILAFEKELLLVTTPQAKSWCLEASQLSKGYEFMKGQGVIKDSSRWSSKCRAIVNWLFSSYQSVKDNLVSQIKERKVQTLNAKIKKIFEEYDAAPTSISIHYNGQPLIKDGVFFIPTDIERVIYVDSPFAATNRTFDPIWNLFQSLLISNPVELENKWQICSKLVQNVIDGTVITKTDEVIDNKFLVFHANNGQDFRLEKVATGIKTFAYIQRLIDTRNLSENSLLLIDEPEAHLHPQWIVELANILVKLHKLLGVKIMIASHNPDMVAAIQAVSMREKLEDVTKFYLAEHSTDSKGSYIFRCLDMDISPIFESFNIALDRIETYGAINNN